MHSTDYELYDNYSSLQGGQFSRLSFQGEEVYVELFNVIIKPRDLWTIFYNPCLKQGMLVQNVIKGRVKAVGEGINVVPVYACTKHRRGNIS